ncbi:uncharacterized protein LOC108741232 isoform X2 [Agrilus planipennis]|nr:uncharacterized protein LOC108741232 isoform X2 [Agrilus planipennis]
MASAFVACKAQYYQQQQNEPEREESQFAYSAPRTPSPQIISHKQALNHDGNFKYAFAAENGLAQGESIAPDGSRTGGYTYVDPNGKKISVKYTAGKDGFKILEGDHIPKAPPHALIAEQSRRAQVQEPSYYKPAPVQQYVSAQPRAQFGLQQPRAAYTQVRPAFTPSNELEQQRDLDYQDEPGKPHSFGSGYVFEFTG